jgi:hypothetical protein
MHREPVDVAECRVDSVCHLSDLMSASRFHDRQLVREALKLPIGRCVCCVGHVAAGWDAGTIWHR